MSPEQQAAFQAAADEALAWSTQSSTSSARRSWSEFFKGKGLNIYTPDVEAFRDARAEEVSRVGARQELAGRHGRQDQRALGCSTPGRRRRCRRLPPDARADR